MLASALTFLTDLRDHNNSEWFRANRATYEAARAGFAQVVKAIHHELAQLDPALRAADPGRALFRINRDVRFSADKSPYKTHFGAVLAPLGPKDPGPVYYLHLEPGGRSGLAGGIWQPPSEMLKQIRQEIDYNAATLRAVLTAESFTRTFGSSFQAGAALKRIPTGYTPDNPAADLLRLKSYTVWQSLPDAQLNSPAFTSTAVATFSQLYPLVRWLRTASTQ